MVIVSKKITTAAAAHIYSKARTRTIPLSRCELVSRNITAIFLVIRSVQNKSRNYTWYVFVSGI